MPRKRLTFIIIPPNDGHVQEYRFSSHLLWVGGLMALLMVSALGFYSMKFHTRVDQTAEIAELDDQNSQLVRSLDRARTELVQLEDRMQDLAMQDRRLRDYHGMDPVRDEFGDLGVGGQDSPDDLPTDYATMPTAKRELLADLAMRIDALQRETLYQRESFSALEDTFVSNKENLRYIPAIWPVDMNKAWKSSNFGKRTDPFTGRPAQHLGVDIAGRRGMPVWATADGVVAFAYHDKHLGNVVVVNHNPEIVDEDGNVTFRTGSLRTEYGHLDEIRVKKGDHVRRNQIVGTMGDTGRSTGPHVHYAVRYQDRQRRGKIRNYLDPQDYLLDERNKEDRASAYVVSSD